MSATEPNDKISLPAFLKFLTVTGLSMNNAMTVASKIYKTYNTPASLAMLTDDRLTSLQIKEKEHRRLILSAIKKAGFKAPSKDPVTLAASAREMVESASNANPTTKNPVSKKRKRGEGGNSNEFLPEPPKEEKGYGEFDFKEVLDESLLTTRAAVVNRAPVMSAWATVVAERMGFKREEALSIASVYTEMNATTKGVSLGIFNQHKLQGLEAAEGGGQPYVEFMGRRPLYRTEEDQWRALLKGDPIPPSTAYRYITNAFRQTVQYIIGAMRLVAASYDPQELNRVAFHLYADFRPEVDGWGKKAEIKCSTILASKRSPSFSNDNILAIDKPCKVEDQEVEKVAALPTSSGAEVGAKPPLIEVDDGSNTKKNVFLEGLERN